jgi:hypothetical protein
VISCVARAEVWRAASPNGARALPRQLGGAAAVPAHRGSLFGCCAGFRVPAVSQSGTADDATRGAFSRTRG